MSIKVVIVGAGAVGTHLGQALSTHGHEVVQVLSRTMDSAKALAADLDCSYAINPKELCLHADLYVLSLPDHAIIPFVKSAPSVKGLLVHTCGSVSLSELRHHAKNCGVLYPLQTFSKYREIIWKDVPVFIEANQAVSEEFLLSLLHGISGSVSVLNSEQRLRLHLAAVFACNFPNFLIGRAQELVKQATVSPALLLPLVRETLQKLEVFSAVEAQTGPARRADEETVKKHLELLSCCPDDQEVYRLLSQAIRNQYQSRG